MANFQERFAMLVNSKGVTNYRIHKDIGCAKTSVANWLDGKTQPDINYLIRLADYFDVSIDYLVGRTDNPTFK